MRNFPYIPKLYSYNKKDFLVTKSEFECFKLLTMALENDYYIFPQIHLPAFIDGQIFKQNWNGAFRHINEKSVDFLLCDRFNLRPLLAIELDDPTHELPNRKKRDVEVERILKTAKFPLLRLKREDLDSQLSIIQKVNDMFAMDKNSSHIVH